MVSGARDLCRVGGFCHIINNFLTTHSVLYIFFFISYADYFELSHLRAAAAKSLQSCLTLCYPIDDSPPGSCIPGILQARTLEWVAISFSNA